MPKEDQTQKSIKVAKATVEEKEEPKAPRKVLLKDWKREERAGE